MTQKKHLRIDTNNLKVLNFEQGATKKIIEYFFKEEKYPKLSNYRTAFIELSDEERELLIEEIKKIHYNYINRLMAEKHTPIHLEDLGQLIIKPGRADYLNLIHDEDLMEIMKLQVEKHKEGFKRELKRSIRRR